MLLGQKYLPNHVLFSTEVDAQWAAMQDIFEVLQAGGMARFGGGMDGDARDADPEAEAARAPEADTNAQLHSYDVTRDSGAPECKMQ